MHLIAVDIGNSAIKLGRKIGFPDAHIESVHYSQTNWQESVARFVGLVDGPVTWAISSVHQGQSIELIEWIQTHTSDHGISVLDEIPITTSVPDRKLVGKDRLLGGLAAINLEVDPDVTDWIVIDAGTAVTVDWFHRQQGFLGGNIYLGADAQFAQMSERTDALPNMDYAYRMQMLKQVSDGSPSSIHSDAAFGIDTKRAILSGVYLTQIGGLRQHVNVLASSITDQPGRKLKVIATGGGWSELTFACQTLLHHSLQTKLGTTAAAEIDAIPDLILRGVMIAHQIISDKTSD